MSCRAFLIFAPTHGGSVGDGATQRTGPGGGLGVRLSPRAISESQCGMLVLAPLTFEVFRVITNPTLVFSPQP